MSDLAARWRAARERMEQRSDEAKFGKPVDPGTPEAERRAYKKLLTEAKAAGATLQNDGKGGLPSSLVLGVMRRDEFRCHRCGDRREITIHHKGGIPESKWLSKKGHHNDPNNFGTLCADCHDAIHDKAREEGTDSSQVTPEGDEGDPRRDKGLPPAKPRS